MQKPVCFETAFLTLNGTSGNFAEPNSRVALAATIKSLLSFSVFSDSTFPFSNLTQ